MINNPLHAEIVKFANWFCDERIQTFQKDMNICMTPNRHGSHAYVPAVMGCASFIELFAGLFAGCINRSVGIKHILNFTKSFLDSSEFTEECVCLFFAMYRHKVAHLSRPYSVFDSYDVNKKNPLLNYLQRRFTWKITATETKPAIQIISQTGEVPKYRRPSWKTAQYTHICEIHLKRLIMELPKAVSGSSGYLKRLSADPKVRANFKKCMDSFYP